MSPDQRVAGLEEENILLRRRVAELEAEFAKRGDGRGQLQAVKFLESVLDNSPAAIMICEAPDGRISYINDAVWDFRGKTDARMTGISVEQYVGTWREFFPDGRPYSGSEMPVARSLLTGEVVRNEQLIVELDDGTRKWAAAWSAPIYNEAKEIIAAVVIFSDVTSQKLAELELGKAKDLAEAANKAKSTFLSSMSHELRTPLSAILGFTEILLREAEPESSQYETLGIIQKSGEHLLSIINDILDLSKIEAGKIEIETSVFDLRELVADLAAILRVRAESRGLFLRVDESPGLPRYVKTDPVKLRQILFNLVGNSIKFTSKGGIGIRAYVPPQAREAASNQVCFEVSDTGSGIPSADVTRVFEPFVQLGHQEGTGLGLALTRRFVQLLGGELSLSSEVGKGSTFNFTIAYESVADGQVAAARASGRIVSIANSAAFKVLVVDDEPMNRRLLKRILTQFGFPLREAEDGLQALGKFEEWKPDLILMDWQMPVLDGLDATREIQRRPESGKMIIIGLTGNAFKSDQELMRDSGCDDVLTKPFRQDDLIGILERHLPIRVVRSPRVSEAIACS